MSKWQRLSGYLHTKPTGPFKRLKGSQRQWHVFDESSMTIRVFRNEEEASSLNKEPLRVINIANAVLYIDTSEFNQFVIFSDGKENVLQAETEEAMLLWLDTLQARRNEAIRNDPKSALNGEPATLAERRKAPRMTITKMPTAFLRQSTTVSFDVNEIQCNSAKSTTKAWRISQTQSTASNSSSPVETTPSPPTRSLSHVQSVPQFYRSCTTSGVPDRILPSSDELRTGNAEMNLITAIQSSETATLHGTDSEGTLEDGSTEEDFTQQPLIVTTSDPRQSTTVSFDVNEIQCNSAKSTTKAWRISQTQSTASNSSSPVETTPSPPTRSLSHVQSVPQFYRSCTTSGVPDRILPSSDELRTGNAEMNLITAIQSSETATLHGTDSEGTLEDGSTEEDFTQQPLIVTTSDPVPDKLKAFSISPKTSTHRPKNHVQLAASWNMNVLLNDNVAVSNIPTPDLNKENLSNEVDTNTKTERNLDETHKNSPEEMTKPHTLTRTESNSSGSSVNRSSRSSQNSQHTPIRTEDSMVASRQEPTLIAMSSRRNDQASYLNPYRIEFFWQFGKPEFTELSKQSAYSD
ncbi:hypothetical protein AHF37_04100 [Paragonimus kellicotti]|nr:hypothetical protein AHF37_04100 [Paragonimus kellicotti]